MVKRITISLLISSTALIANGSLAQGDSAGFTIEEVIVTARKREENLQETPISISTFTTDTLERRQIGASNELAKVTPNLTFDSHAPASGSNAGGQIFIRGIGQTDFQALTDPGVGMYINGVYYARTVGSVVDFLDVAQIDVLRGPQGTLFGRNTIGGAIDIKTKTPGDEFGGDILITLGSDSRTDATAAVDLPLSDNLAIRLNAGLRKRDGYVDRLIDGTDLGDDDSRHLAGRLVWDVSDSFSLDIAADYTEEDENGQPTVFAGINTGSTFPILASLSAGCPGSSGPPTPVPDDIADQRCANNQFLANGSDETSQTFPTYSRLRTKGASITANWELEQFSLKSITAYRELTANAGRDADSTPVDVLSTIFATEDEQFSQELQISGAAFSDRLQWLVGLYYFDQSARDSQDVNVPTGSLLLDGPVDVTSKALFAQATYDITEKLSWTFGVRFTDEKKSFLPQTRTTSENFLFPVPDSLAQNPAYSALLQQLSPTGLFMPNDIPPPVTHITVPQGTFLVPPVNSTVDETVTTPMLNVAYQLTEDLLLYGAYSEGFKGGGINFRFIEATFAPLPYEPEFVDSYEVGFKSDWFDQRLRLNGAVFFTEYSDIQIVTVPVLAPITLNAADGEIRGFELEFTALPSPNLEIVGGIGFIDAEYTSVGDQVLQNSTITANSEFRQTPEWSANIGISYVINLTDALRLTPHVDLSYRDDVFFDAENSAEIAQESYSLVNASLTLDIQDSWKVILGISNVTDEEYRVAGFSTLNATSGYSESVFAREREWYLSVKKSF